MIGSKTTEAFGFSCRRLPSSSSIPSVITGGSIFSFGGKFRYSGRVEKEVLEESAHDVQQPLSRSNSLRVKASSVPDTPVTPINSDLDLCIQQQLNDSPIVTDIDLLYMDNESKEKSSNDPSGDIRCNFPDYYMQETLGHSYSESQLSRVSRIRGSGLSRPGAAFVHASLSPVPISTIPVTQAPPPPSPSHHATRIAVPTTALPTTLPKNVVASSSKFKFMRVFWPSFVAAAVVVIIVMIILLETETEAFSAIREMPEMVSLRLHYYDHIKQFLKFHVSS